MTLPFRFRPGGNARWLWLIIAAAALAASVWLLLGWRDVERSTRLTTDAGTLRGLVADTRRAAEQARTSGDIAALEGVLAATRTSGETAFDGAPAVLGEERAEQVARRVSSGLATLEREARSFARGETADERFNAAFYAVADELDALLRTVSDSGLGQTGRLRWLLAVAFAAGTLGTVAGVAGWRRHRRRLIAAEVIAREQEERFLRALDRAADAVVLVGSDMRLQYVNDAACRLSGYRREEMLGRSYGEFFVNFDLDPARAAHELDELGSGRFVRRMRRADGKELTVEHNVVALGDGTYLGVAHDMTPQGEAKAALRESEEHLKAVTETVRSGLVIRDRQQRPIWFNQAACEMFGYTREEFANLTLDHLIVSDDPGRAKERFSARVDGELGNGRARLRARRKDGQVINVEISSMPFKRDGEVVGVLEELRDVMEELTLKRQIEETAKEITGFFETAPNPLILFDEDGKVLRANFAVRELFGWEPDELVGQDVSVLAADLDPAEHMRYVRHDRKTGEPSTAEGFVLGRTREIIARKKDGTEFPAQLMVNEMPATGQRRRYIGALIDLTDRRLAEERLLQAQKSEALGTLVAGVAHDFNNLLTAIGGSIHLASTRPDERDRWLASAEDATNRAADVVRQLLQFSRHEEPGRAPVDLFELTRQVVELCQETFDRRIDLSLHAVSQPLPIHADRSQLEQVLMNLLVNARDAVIERLEGEPSDSLYRPRITVTVHVREPAGNGEDPQSSLELTGSSRRSPQAAVQAWGFRRSTAPSRGTPGRSPSSRSRAQVRRSPFCSRSSRTARGTRSLPSGTASPPRRLARAGAPS